MSPLLAIGIILLCVLGEAFFSGSEIALVSVDRLQIRHAAKKGHRASRNLQDVLKNPEWILGTTLLGTNICTVTSTTLAATQFYAWLGALGVPLSIVIMTFKSGFCRDSTQECLSAEERSDCPTDYLYFADCHGGSVSARLALFANCHFAGRCFWKK
jgi:hypothetical protein